MNKIKFSLGVLIIAAFCSNADGIPISDPLVILNKITDKVIVLNIEPPSSNNVIAINTAKGIVVIDTEISPTLADLIKAKITEVFNNDNFRYVINTHSHGDHTWGNQVFKDAVIIGHENCISEMAGLEEDVQTEMERYKNSIARMGKRLDTLDQESESGKRLKQRIDRTGFILAGYTNNFVPTKPNILFNNNLTLNLGDITLELSWYGNAHSKSDILVYCPEENLLITGDVFIHKMNPSYFKTDNLDQLPRWISCLEKIKDNNGNIKYIIPGHNDQLLTIDDFTNTLTYIKTQAELMNGKKSAYPVFMETMNNSGADVAINKFLELNRKSSEYYILEADYISQGYYFLYQKKDAKSAIIIFKTISELFPYSWNAFDCLGEAYYSNGERELALGSYKKALEINPDYDNAKQMIEKINGELLK